MAMFSYCGLFLVGKCAILSLAHCSMEVPTVISLVLLRNVPPQQNKTKTTVTWRLGGTNIHVVLNLFGYMITTIFFVHKQIPDVHTQAVHCTCPLTSTNVLA